MDELERYYCRIPEELSPYMRYFDQGPIEDIPDAVFSEKKYVPLREYAVFRMGFSVVTKKLCRALLRVLEDQPVLEVMCGLGAYSATLRSLGKRVYATDDMSWIDYEASKYRGWKRNAWVPDVESLNAVQAIEKYGRQVGTVLMSWPPQNEPFALDALLCMRKVNPDCRLLYIGEAMGGCTANNDFFRAAVDLSEDSEAFSAVRRLYHAWTNDGYYDNLYLMK